MHPKEAKMRLAEIIISQYHSPDAAKQERLEFERVFSAKELPVDMPVYTIGPIKKTIIEVLIESGLVNSKNEARRLVQQGGVTLDGVVLVKDDAVMDREGVIKAGKRRFLKLSNQ